MNSGRSASVCRRYINGSCRYGPRCIYRHELPVFPSAQICWHYQKGGCRFGERCKFLHVLQSDIDAANASRRASVSSVPSSHVARTHPDGRGLRPSLLQTEVTSSRECSRSGIVVNITNSQNSPAQLVLDVAEEDAESPQTTLTESFQSLNAANAGACEGRIERTFSTEATEEGAAAAASGPQVGMEEAEAFLQSKDVTCGICMDKVYEKIDPRDRVFGLLPNCNHSFCLQCIMTWRKTKEFGPDVVKSCPQCRVRSAFYVPHKYWVDGQAKESLIAAFKERCSKKSCGYYARSRCCPFKSECLYQHKPTRRSSFPYPTDDEDDYDGIDLLNFFIAMTLLSGEDDDDDDFDDYDFPFVLSEEDEY